MSDTPKLAVELTQYPLTKQDVAYLQAMKTIHALVSADEVDRITQIRNATHDLAEAILTYCPPSRARSVALTHLETALMWAVESITP